MVELKACAHCGGEALLRKSEQFHYGQKQFRYGTACDMCPCVVGISYDDDGDPWHQFETEAEAAEAWNRRASPWRVLPAVPTPGEAPFDGAPVLLWSPYVFEPGGHAWVSGGWGKAAISPNEFRGQTGRQWPTHYAPLPSAPDAREEA